MVTRKLSDAQRKWGWEVWPNWEDSATEETVFASGTAHTVQVLVLVQG